MSAEYATMIHLIPDYMQAGMLRWIEHGIPPGSFLEAVIKNDLMHAFEKADSTNEHCMRDYVIFLYNYAPSDCFGSKEAYGAWKAQGGLMGLVNTEALSSA